MSAQPSSIGYGPRHRTIFDGDESHYELWETKMLAHMRLVKLYDTIAGTGALNDEKNKDAFTELVQCLDDRSLSLIIREANQDGRKPLQILRAHYIGTGKPRVLTFYHELSSLKMGANEDITG